MKTRTITFFMAMLMWLGGCNSGMKNDRLEAALQLSGDNRQELERVLAHYSSTDADSLKLKAAIFLIENMPGHWGPDSSSIADYIQEIDSLKTLSFEKRRMVLNVPAQHPELFPEMKRTEDVRHIRANDLILHIEQCFKLKDSCPWLTNIDFDLFCEYLLPYRIENEVLEFRQENQSVSSVSYLQFAAENYDNCQNSVYAIFKYMKMRNAFPAKAHLKNKAVEELAFHAMNASKMEVFRFREMGIPCRRDYDPIVRPGSIGKAWSIPVDPRMTDVAGYKIDGEGIGKIYSDTYSHNPFPVAVGDEYVPPFFRSPFRMDVTDRYLYTTDVALKLDLPDDVRHVYLAMFDGREWQPVAWCRPEKTGICRFKKMGKDCIYLPVYYPQGKIKSLSSPFELDITGKVGYLDGGFNTVDVQIERMFPYESLNRYYNENMIGSFFLCDNDPAFINPDTVFMVENNPHFRMQEIKVALSTPKRYWRLHLPNKYNLFSELQFCGQDGRILNGTFINKDMRNITNLTDNDPETIKSVFEKITMDLGTPTTVCSIRYMHSSGQGNLKEGNNYQVEYYDGQEWKSCGRMLAGTDGIYLKAIPAKRFYRIWDCTTNQCGWPFTIEQGKIRYR